MKTLTKILGIAGLALMGTVAAPKTAKPEEVPQEAKEIIKDLDLKLETHYGIGSSLPGIGSSLPEVGSTADIGIRYDFGKSLLSEKSILMADYQFEAGKVGMHQKLNLSYLKDISRKFRIDEEVKGPWVERPFFFEQSNVSLGIGASLDVYRAGTRKIFWGLGPVFSAGEHTKKSGHYQRSVMVNASLILGELIREEELSSFAATIYGSIGEEVVFKKNMGLGYDFGLGGMVSSKGWERTDYDLSAYWIYKEGASAITLGAKLFACLPEEMPANGGLLVEIGLRAF
ncbi:MAG: hypothetical protein ABIB71_03715 [Candidatus Woesearchaeota archaeon]